MAFQKNSEESGAVKDKKRESRSEFMSFFFEGPEGGQKGPDSASGSFITDHAISSGKCLTGNSSIFQHGDNPKHTAKAVKSYLERKIADKALDWPPQSPDLNVKKAACTEKETRGCLVLKKLEVLKQGR